MSSESMDSIECHKEGKPKKCPPAQPSWWRIICQASIAAFLTTYIYSVLAWPALVVYTHYGAGLGLYGFGALNAAVLFGLGLVFNQFGGWIYFLGNLAFTEFFCCELRRPWMLGVKALVGSIFALGGYYAGLATAIGIYSFSLHRISPVSHLGWGGTFFFEMIAILLTTLVYCFSSREYSGVWGVLGIAVVQGAIYTLLYPVIGIAGNWWLTAATCSLIGNCNHVGLWAKLVGGIVAIIVVAIVKFFFWPVAKLKMM